MFPLMTSFVEVNRDETELVFEKVLRHPWFIYTQITDISINEKAPVIPSMVTGTSYRLIDNR